MTVSAALEIDLGDDLEISASFVNGADDPTDPTTVTFALTAPDGTVATYTVGDPEVANPAVGSYLLVVVPDQAGRWYYSVTGTGNGVESAEDGAVDVDPTGVAASSTPFSRWGITVDAAIRITGTAGISTASLENAEDEIVDVIGWIPDETAYDVSTDVRARAFGRAIAWQAAHRAAAAATPTDGAGARIVSESLAGDYSVTYAEGGASEEDPELAPRARRLLADYGWIRNSGASVGSALRRQSFDDWQRNRI